MKKKILLFTLIMCFTSMFIVISLFAGSTIKDVIKMEDKTYKEHTKGIVEFQHKKHAENRKLECGACHHDDKGKPLTLKAGDNVAQCITCHKIAGEKPKGQDAPKLTPAEQLKYHAEAMHKNCKTCHTEYNKKNNTKAAPTTCTGCHPKA